MSKHLFQSNEGDDNSDLEMDLEASIPSAALYDFSRLLKHLFQSNEGDDDFEMDLVASIFTAALYAFFVDCYNICFSGTKVMTIVTLKLIWRQVFPLLLSMIFC